MARRKHRSGHRVCLLAYDGLCTFEFAVAAEIFRDRSDTFGDQWYSLTVCALEPAPLRTDSGLVLPKTAGQTALLGADTVIVPGWRLGPVPESISSAVARAHRRGARIASICTGAFVLAAAGVLDGKRATTHWKHAGRLAAQYPAVQVDPGVLYVDAGDVVTSAGSAAGIDMLLHLIRKDYGSQACNAVARAMVVPPHRDGGQAQYVESAVPAQHSEFSKVFDYIRRHPDRSHRIETLAAMVAMTPRTFFRRFRAATGLTPYDWLLHERIRIAKDLLETSRRSIDRIASDAGFGSADTLRHHFRRVVGATPRDFRNLFQRAAKGAQPQR
jgi:AraC family transcriptional activator FtrA